jgi:hypothetical protein
MSNVTGSSQSLNGMITEIITFLKDDGKRPAGRGADLRQFLREKIANYGLHWYKRGVRRGRIESLKEWRATGKLARKFAFEATREFLEGESRDIRVKHRAKA